MKSIGAALLRSGAARAGAAMALAVTSCAAAAAPSPSPADTYLLPIVPAHHYTPHLKLAGDFASLAARPAPVAASPAANKSAVSSPTADEVRAFNGTQVGVGSTSWPEAGPHKPVATGGTDGPEAQGNWRSGSLLSVLIVRASSASRPGLVLGAALIVGLLVLRGASSGGGTRRKLRDRSPRDAMTAAEELPSAKVHALEPAERLNFDMTRNQARGEPATAAGAADTMELRKRASAHW
ncbi:MAG TPA: hypothetical protein VHE37_12290, partial [Nevskiaceae bacterium]|nr:hypothetical protein [Nevskiaceae bacterium]